VADALYHVIARRVARRPIFRDDRDRNDFLRRLAALSGEEAVGVFAFALMHILPSAHAKYRRGGNAACSTSAVGAVGVAGVPSGTSVLMADATALARPRACAARIPW
jgi:hypothetical protein